MVVYNWSEYIPEGVIEQFTKETGIKVEYSTYESNEVMYAKIQLQKGRATTSSSLDLPYRQNARRGSLKPIDRNLLKISKNLNRTLLNKPYDPGNQYSVPICGQHRNRV